MLYRDSPKFYQVRDNFRARLGTKKTPFYIGSKTLSSEAMFTKFSVWDTSRQWGEHGVGNFWFLYPLVLSNWEDLAFSVCIIFEESVFIFQFLNDKMHNYVLLNAFVRFIIQKLKNKHIFLKTEKTNFFRWENLAFSVLKEVCLFFNFWIIKRTNALNKT